MSDAGAPEDALGMTGGGFDLGAMLAQAQEMQQQLLDAQAAAAATVLEGQAGGGAVRIRVTGGLNFQAVEIAPDVLAEGDAELVGDLVLAALHDAVDRINELSQQAMGGMDPTALDLGGLLGVGPGDDDDDDDDDD